MQMSLTKKRQGPPIAAKINHWYLISWVACRAADRWLDGQMTERSYKTLTRFSSQSSCMPVKAALFCVLQTLNATCIETASTSECAPGIQTGGPLSPYAFMPLFKAQQSWLPSLDLFNNVLRRNSQKRLFCFVSLCPICQVCKEVETKPGINLPWGDRWVLQPWACACRCFHWRSSPASWGRWRITS